MAQHAFDDSVAGLRPAQRASSSGWKQLFWFAVAAAGIGFAGYVYLVPYHQVASALDARSRELHEERASGEVVTAERDRLKTSLGQLEGERKDRSAAETRHKGDVEGMAAQLKASLEALGAGVTTDGERVTVSLADRAVDKNGIDVSGEGSAVLKILAGTVKKSGSSVRIKARFGTAPAPKQLRSLFGTVGEVSAVRAARVMSALQGIGLAPERLSIVGEAEKAKSGGGGKGKRGAAAAAAGTDRLDLEIEP
jgi:hypothetical protein